MVQSRVTTDLVCAMVCASEGNGQQKSGRHGGFDLRFGLRLVCALVCARHTGRSANQIKPRYPKNRDGQSSLPTSADKFSKLLLLKGKKMVPGALSKAGRRHGRFTVTRMVRP